MMTEEISFHYYPFYLLLSITMTSLWIPSFFMLSITLTSVCGSNSWQFMNDFHVFS